LNIRCFILCTEGRCFVKEVDPEKQYFSFRNGDYPIIKQATKKNKENQSELIYIENNPLPIGTPQDIDPKDFLSSMMKQRALQDVKGELPMNPFLEALLSYFKNPGKLLMLAIVLLLIGIIAQQYLPQIFPR